MFDKAKELGIDAYGGSRQGMYLVSVSHIFTCTHSHTCTCAYIW